MGPAGAVLRIAMTLTSVSRQWREATLQAVKALPSLKLQPDKDLPPRFLSPLLAELVEGRPDISLHVPLLNTPEAGDFIDAAAPGLLRAYGPHSASAEVSDLLATCEGLRDLYFGQGLVPTSLPPYLGYLVVCLDGAGASQHLSTVLSTAASHSELMELKVWLSGCDVVLPEPFPDLGGICDFTVCFDYSSETKLQHFAALEAAAAGHVSLDCEISMTSAESSPVRQRLWAALGQVRFEQLRISVEYASDGDDSSPAELPQLASVHCGKLVLCGLLGGQFTDQLLHNIHCAQLCCHDQIWDHPSSLSWSQLTVRAGIYMIELHHGAGITVEGCSGCLPAFDQAWALVLVQPQQGKIRGLPLSSFRAGPHGHLVWGNHAVTEARLKAAYAEMRV